MADQTGTLALGTGEDEEEEGGSRKEEADKEGKKVAKQSDHLALGVGDSVGDVENDRLLLLPHLPGPGLVVLPRAGPLHQQGAGEVGREDRVSVTEMREDENDDIRAGLASWPWTDLPEASPMNFLTSSWA